MAPTGMGMFAARVRIFSDDERQSVELDMIVDTGAVFTWVPKEVAARLGLRSRGTQRFRAIDRGGIERPIGNATIECAGGRGNVTIVFGEPGDAQVLGMIALETLGLQVDPRGQTLHHVDELPAYATA